MTILAEAPQHTDLDLSALRRGDSLVLRFKVTHAMHVHLDLHCPHSGWRWSEDLGLVLPGDEQAQVQLPGWPEEASLLVVNVLGGTWRGRRQWSGWVAGATAFQGAYLCS